jgi:hypothetical protein
MEVPNSLFFSGWKQVIEAYWITGSGQVGNLKWGSNMLYKPQALAKQWFPHCSTFETVSPTSFNIYSIEAA